MKSIGLFTIASKNYLSYVRTLLASVARVHPEYQLFLCLADRVEGHFDPAAEPYTIVEAAQLGIPTFADMALRYDIMELNTAVKPFMFRWLLEHTDLEAFVYLDPDIRVFSRFGALESRLDAGASVVFTPHITQPLEDGRKPGDHDILQAGVFNLGFMAARRCLDAQRFIDWWGRRLLTEGYSDFAGNRFVDQRWCDLAPGFVDELAVLKHPGYNVAYWNLSQRVIARAAGGAWQASGQDLVFFHFSGIELGKAKAVSKHQDRLSWKDVAACHPLFEQYREELAANGWERMRRLPYAYGRASERLELTAPLRRLYRTVHPEPGAPDWANLEPFMVELCNHPAEGVRQEGGARVSRLMHQIYRSRQDLQDAFPLSRPDGRQSFVAWFAEAGGRDYGLPDFLTRLDAPAGAAAPGSQEPAPASFAGYALLVKLERLVLGPVYRRLPAWLQKPALRLYERALAWTLRDTRAAAPSARPFPYLDQPADVRQLVEQRVISNLMHMIWLSRPDLRHAFNLDTPAGQQQFVQWYEVSATREYGLEPHVPAAGESARTARMSVAGEPGANLIGYARAELGLGEHVRLSASALATTDVAYGVVDFGVGVSSRKQAQLDLVRLISRNQYKANLFHITADRMLSVLCHLGRPFFHQRYNILYPFWELANWPDEWVPVLHMFDEIWAPSRFIEKSVSARTALPVTYMPMCIAPAPARRFGRRHFNLPEGHFLFLFAFDFFSFMERKNPFGTIRAFKKAFPDRKDVGLVLKVMNGDAASAQWQSMLALIDGDARISVLNATMDRDEVLDLYSAADCYVSLHRSEGFGLGLAESMHLGKPVIATNYSGNTDFTQPDNACLVDFRLIPVEPGQYVYEQGQVWADPDLDQAAWFMAKLASDRTYRDGIAGRGRKFIHDNLSREAIGLRYRTRLRELGLV